MFLSLPLLCGASLPSIFDTLILTFVSIVKSNTDPVIAALYRLKSIRRAILVFGSFLSHSDGLCYEQLSNRSLLIDKR